MVMERWLVFKISKYSHEALWLVFKISKYSHKTLWLVLKFLNIIIKHNWKKYGKLLKNIESIKTNITKGPYKLFRALFASNLNILFGVFN